MCIVLVLVTVSFGLWTMMAELSFSVEDFILFVFFVCFQQYSSRHRKQIRQLRAPSLLDSSRLVALVLLPAPRQAGRDCSALCVLFSYSLLCVLGCGRSWQSSVFRLTIFSSFYSPISAIQLRTPQANTTAAGTVAAGQQRPFAPTTPAGAAPSR